MVKIATILAASAALAGAAIAQDTDPGLEFAFEEVVTLAPAVLVGETPRGMRQFIPITGGSFTGPGIKGQILAGGWDWQLVRKDGCTEIEADYFLKTDDGVVINVVNTGVLCPPKDGVFAAVRTQPVFEAPIGKYDWLNRTAFVGTLEPARDQPVPAVRIKFYKAV